MNEKINLLIEITQELKLKGIEIELNIIQDRFNAENKEIIIPIVGEFSSGKTSLLNALSTSKKLETASKPTTAVIYEMYFGSEIESAELFKQDTLIKTFDNLSEIKNDELDDIDIIRVYDTSKKVPNSTILVDTPGLSSNSPEHIEALCNYLPHADALFLCVDANQQLTKSMISFLEVNSLSHLPLYLIITKCDTKAPSEIEEIKSYIASNIKLKIEKVITVSSKKNSLLEFENLIMEIQLTKNVIVNKALEYKINSTAQYLLNYLEELISSTTMNSDAQTLLKNKKRELDKIENNISLLIQDVNLGLNNSERDCVKSFESTITAQFDELLVTNSTNIDARAFSVVNSVSTLMFSNFQNEILTKCYAWSNERKYGGLGDIVRTLQSIDVSDLQLGQLSYNINLESAGSQQIKQIATGIKVLTGVALAAATAGVTSIATATGITASTAVRTGSSLAASNVLNTVDSATDVANIISNVKTRKTVANIGNLSKVINKQMPLVDKYDGQIGQMISPNAKKGFVENIVSKVGDGFLGKPQRRKMIQEYLTSTLLPEFENNLQTVKMSLLNDIQVKFKSEVTTFLQQYKDNIEELERLNNEVKQDFLCTVTKYKNYVNQIKS